MAEIYYDEDADPSVIQRRRVAVLGYGSQGQAHALSLRDSGADVRIGLPEGSHSRARAAEQGLRVLTPAQAAAEADLIMMLVPDPEQAAVYRESVAPHLEDGDALFFAHGFNICFEFIRPPANVDVVMVAPKGPGNLVRRYFEQGLGVPCVVAVEQDATGGALRLGLSYARAIGGTRAGVIRSTFAEATETELFGGQAVLAGGTAALVKAGFETLVEAGYQPELAYFACLHELKPIVDFMYEGGLSKMRRSISHATEWGDYLTGPRIITNATKMEMKEVLAEIQDGSFADTWMAEYRAGMPNCRKYQAASDHHMLEVTGRRLRPLMSWLCEEN